MITPELVSPAPRATASRAEPTAAPEAGRNEPGEGDDFEAVLGQGAPVSLDESQATPPAATMPDAAPAPVPQDGASLAALVIVPPAASAASPAPIAGRTGEPTTAAEPIRAAGVEPRATSKGDWRTVSPNLGSAAAQAPIAPVAAAAEPSSACPVAKPGEELAGPPQPRFTVPPEPVESRPPALNPQPLGAGDTSAPAVPGADLKPLPGAAPALARVEPQVPQPVQPPTVTAQITLAVSDAKEPQIEIRLDPPELGRVQIHLHPSDGALKAVVMAERLETQDLLRRHAETLVRDLGEAGYGNVELEFGGGGRMPQRPEEPGLLLGPAADAAAEPARLAAAPARPTLVWGGLDIRL